MRRILLAVTFLAYLPVMAAASTVDSLLGDVDLFEEDLSILQEAEEAQWQDSQSEQNSDLFPVGTNEAERPSILERSEPFLSISLDGQNITFEDVPNDAWFAPFVRGAIEAHIVSGYRDAEGKLLGRYGPSDTVTVEQVAKMAFEAAGVDRSSCPLSPENETAKDSWSAEYIACAEASGWVVFSDAVVDVHRHALRSEIVVTVLQAFGMRFGPASGTIFDDVFESIQFAGAIEQAAHDAIVSGYTDAEGNPTGFFGPHDAVNRAETAKIIVLAKQVYDEK